MFVVWGEEVDTADADTGRRLCGGGVEIAVVTAGGHDVDGVFVYKH